ncbi:hypothetical protein FACS1894190_05440 [Spirochaetia bacterium]|nr:hypothetical protein FACS1894190_05440 [Spirochaetia bacterium]
MTSIASLAVISGFNLNLVLTFALGVEQIHSNVEKPNLGKILLLWISLFLSNFAIWLMWTYIFGPLSLGFLGHFLIFPILFLFFLCLESFVSGIFPQLATKTNGPFQNFSSVALSFASSTMTLLLAAGAADALMLSFGFSTGAIAAIVLTGAIDKRITNEKIPAKVRGVPLLLISMGLLSLVFNAAAFVLLNSLQN